MKNIKQTLKNNKMKSIAITLIIFTVFHGAVTLANQNRIIQNAKAEMIELKKPSLVEIQKQELNELESNWRAAENQLNLRRDLFIKIQEEIRLLELDKPEIEENIRIKRNEILGIKK